jgi:hypothetical protein
VSNRPHKFIIVVCLLLFGSFLLLPTRRGSAKNIAFQTWPTRTPTPDSAPPTDTPSGGNGSPAPPTSTPESGGTPAPGVTPSNTPEPGTTATRAGGIVPTADPCELPPTVLALGMVNVREGPGIDYQPIGRLFYLDVRPIIGRSEFAPWWLIQLPDGIQGWVADRAVTAQGYTGFVPIVPPPLIGGVNPTPGLSWDPTPNPICTPPPTVSSTRTPGTVDSSDSPATKRTSHRN